MEPRGRKGEEGGEKEVGSDAQLMPMLSLVFATTATGEVPTCWMGVSLSLGLMQSVAPSCLASSNLAGFVSIAKILEAFLALAACSRTHARSRANKKSTITERA